MKRARMACHFSRVTEKHKSNKCLLGKCIPAGHQDLIKRMRTKEQCELLRLM